MTFPSLAAHHSGVPFHKGCAVPFTNGCVDEPVHTGGRGVSVVYDGVGAATWDMSRAVLGHLGTLVSFGNAGGKVGLTLRKRATRS
jgi:NADPH:quinone reductase-like Zn-dependent oxidoreductase